MDLKEKYYTEISLLKNERIHRVIQAAKQEFYKHGITNAKFKDIAKRAQVGEASVYRYFKDKFDLANMVALDYWEEMSITFKDYYQSRTHEDDDAIQLVKTYLMIFIDLYDHHKKFIKFMEDFSTYVSSYKKDYNEYSFETHVNNIKEIFKSIFVKGQNDGTIRNDLEADIAYGFVSQVMVSTTQKLLLRSGHSHQNDANYAHGCLSRLITMYLEYIKNEE